MNLELRDTIDPIPGLIVAEAWLGGHHYRVLTSLGREVAWLPATTIPYGVDGVPLWMVLRKSSGTRFRSREDMMVYLRKQANRDLNAGRFRRLLHKMDW